MPSEKDLPWQITAKKLINFANKFKNTNDEFERQVGYLLLDVGVETLLRSYLTMPNTKAKMNFAKRDEAAKGTIEKDNIAGKKITLSSFDELSFHNLILAVKQAAEDTVDTSDLEKTEYFHNIRNKIYHLGDGIVPTKENFEEYLKLGDSLLRILLGISAVSRNINSDDNDMSREESSDGIPDFLRYASYKNFEFKVALATEILRPEYASRNFEAKLKKIDNLYDEENVRESQEKIINNFSELIGKKIEDLSFIRACINDVTFLRLNALKSKMEIDTNDIEKYLDYRSFLKSPTKTAKEITSEYTKREHDILNWEIKILEKIDAVIKPYIAANNQE